MNREEKFRDALGYFSSSDHWLRLMAALQEPDPRNVHIHSYVAMGIEPASAEAIICGIFEKYGWPSVRRIDYMSPREALGSLHGIEPKGKPHFDFQWFCGDVGVRACDGGESGCNLLTWNKWYIERFYGRYPLRTEIGHAEEEALRAYFRSEHWKKGCELVLQDTTTHFHFNVETSIHPDIIRRFAGEALAAQGWKIDYVCPNVYLVKGEYQGKLVFMGRDPEEVYDIGWKFNPDVILQATDAAWVFETQRGYDLWDRARYDKMMEQGDYIRLTDKQISEIIAAA